MNVHELIEMQRRTMTEAGPRSVSERVDQLDMLHTAIRQRENILCDALRSDLGKSAGEAYLAEIGPVLGDLSYIIRHLKRWARPKRVLSPLAFFPGRSYILKEPYGVALIMAPWHYPFLLSLSPLIGALAAGNHCVLKPSAYAPATAQAVAGLVSACFPPEQAAVVTGGREESQALMEERYDYIFFTGGVEAGKRVLEMAAKHVTPVTLALGGKSPCIVDDSADLAAAARRIALGKALNAGQSSVAPDYLLVQEKVKDALLSRIRACWEQFYGDPFNSLQWPRMIDGRHYQRVMRLMDGEQVCCGGVGDGQRIAPTLLTDVSWDAPIMQTEVFGPVLPVISFLDVDEIIPKIKEREKPLALYLFTRKASVREKVLRQVPFGGGCVNDPVIQPVNPRLPFGGVGQSGLGKYHGKYSFDTFTHEKAVVIRKNFPDLPARFPPFTEGKDGITRLFMR